MASVDACRRVGKLFTFALAAGFSFASQLAPQGTSQPGMQPPVVSRRGGPTTRSIEGTVLNSGGSPVPGAIVLLKDTKTLQVRSYIAQQDGRYHFYGLSTDINYQVRAEHDGTTSKTRTISVFDSHRNVRLNLKLTKKMKSS
jgi:hypothetical protein